MASYFSILVINPADWESSLEGRDALPAVLMYDPTNTQKPTFICRANATLREFFFPSDTGYPPDGVASITILVDTFRLASALVGSRTRRSAARPKVVRHRDTINYVGNITGGESFVYDESKYPIVRATF